MRLLSKEDRERRLELMRDEFEAERRALKTIEAEEGRKLRTRSSDLVRVASRACISSLTL